MEGVLNEGDEKGNCPGLFDHRICIDGLPEPWTEYKLKQGDSQDRDPPCLVYDFGIRAEPQFGATVARVFGCEVHAFDPSPVSTEWWESDGQNCGSLCSTSNSHVIYSGAPFEPENNLPLHGK